MRELVIGVDESGTGAWSGPFTVCAVVSDRVVDERLVEYGVKDSKKLTDRRRRELVPLIADTVHCAYTVLVSVDEIRSVGQGKAWSSGVISAIQRALEISPIEDEAELTVLIDGSIRSSILKGLKRIDQSCVRFEKKADDRFAAVSAASILAKTFRNDEMLSLHNEFPEYHWDSNYGYGTPAHIEAIDDYGVCIHHRPIKALEGVRKR